MDTDELEQRLSETAFAIKAEELFYEVRTHQLMQPILEEIEDRIKKEHKFIYHSWTKFHDLVIYSIPYFYELEFVPKEGRSIIVFALIQLRLFFVWHCFILSPFVFESKFRTPNWTILSFESGLNRFK